MQRVVHETIVIERVFDAAVPRVFAAWAQARLRRNWAVPNPDWEAVEGTEDFRVGGFEIARFGPKGNPYLRSETRYLHIVEGARIIMAGTMFASDVPISCSMATVELAAKDAGTKMCYTEQAAFLDARDEPASRQLGWNINFDELDVMLTQPT